MAEPSQDLLRRFEERRPRTAMFQGARDQAAVDRYVREYVHKLGAAVHLIPRASRRSHPDNGGPVIDTLDGDVRDVEFAESDVRHSIRVLIDHEPSQQLLTKYGIEEDRDVVIHVPFSALRALELVDTAARFRGVALGDLFVWDGTFYIVRESHRTSYYGLTDLNLFTSAFCNRYHYDAGPQNAESPQAVRVAPPPPLAKGE